MTGNYTVSGSDGADGSSLGIGRTYATRQAGVVDPMFGPGWVSSVAGTNALSKTNSLVQVGQPDGSKVGFSQTTTSPSGATYAPQIGVRGSSVVYASSSDKYTLTDGAGNSTTYTLVGTTYEPRSHGRRLPTVHSQRKFWRQYHPAFPAPPWSGVVGQ
jgi:hypothetical protein